MSLTPFIIAGISLVAIIILVLLASYVKARPDEALLISGLRKKPKTLIGKAGLRIPFFERKDSLSLQLISIDVKTSTAVPTADFINIIVDSVVNVKISDEPELLQLAAQNFLNRDTEYIAKTAREVLEGNMREIVGKMSLQEMVNDRKKFSDLVTENAKPDLERIGLIIKSFNVQNFIDENKVIENLGVDNIVKISKQAAIARAESERDIAVAKAKAEKDANDAKVESDTAIATKNNEYALKKAELDTKENEYKARADSQYAITEQERRKEVEVATADANIARQEKEILLKQKEVEIAEQKLSAEIEKKADAEKYARTAAAEALLYERTKNAESALVEIQRQSDAARYKQEQEAIAIEKLATAKKNAALAEAEGIAARGKAEAEAIQAKALAEAQGTLKKAEALAKMNETGKIQMQLEALKEIAKIQPAIAEAVAKPLSAIDTITMYGDGNVAKLTEELTKSTKQISDGLLGGLGIDLKSLLGNVLASKVATDAPNE